MGSITFLWSSASQIAFFKDKGGEMSLFWGEGIAKKYRTLMAQKFDAFLFNPLPNIHPEV